MPNFPTIDDFFSPKVPPTEKSTRAHFYQKQIEPGDGFIVGNAPQERIGDQAVSNAGFRHHNISSLKLGMKKVSITGRVVNLWESNQTKSSSEGSSVRLFQLAIRDDTGIIEVGNSPAPKVVYLWLILLFVVSNLAQQSFPIYSNAGYDEYPQDLYHLY